MRNEDRRDGSAAARALLAFALYETRGLSLPDIAVSPGGKPYFPRLPDAHFSLSHTDGWVLCALSDSPVGADAQARRALPSERCLLRLTDERERADFDFFELWSLREAYFKLTGRGDLRTIRFRRQNGAPAAPEPGVFSRLYTELPNCAAALCAYTDDFPEAPTEVPPEIAAKLYRRR